MFGQYFYIVLVLVMWNFEIFSEVIVHHGKKQYFCKLACVRLHSLKENIRQNILSSLHKLSMHENHLSIMTAGVTRGDNKGTCSLHVILA